MVALTDATGTHIASLDVKQSTASALQATIRGEVSQTNASALKATAEIYQANASALKATAEVYQAVASALNVQGVGNVASGVADSGNPLKIGGHSFATSPTVNTTNNRSDGYFDLHGRLMVRSGHQSQDQWTATCAPTDSVIRAVATKSAGAGNVRNVCTGFAATIAGGSTAPTAGSCWLSILDGTETGNVLFKTVFGVQAVAGMMGGIAQTDLWLKSSQASGLTMMFNNNGCANLLQSVTFYGTTVTEP
jgi:hypothetical protein